MPAQARQDSGKASLRLTADRNLVLIGARASGKTSVGQILARLLNRPFVDLDEELVAVAGRTVAEIVAQEGWPGFRRREKAMVKRFAALAGQVLATGGGVVLDPENVALLRERGLIVWLRAPAATLGRRLREDRAGRDFRPSLTGAAPEAEMAQVLAEREPLYRAAAHLTVDTENLSVEEIAARLFRMLSGSAA